MFNLKGVFIELVIWLIKGVQLNRLDWNIIWNLSAVDRCFITVSYSASYFSYSASNSFCCTLLIVYPNFCIISIFVEYFNIKYHAQAYQSSLKHVQTQEFLKIIQIQVLYVWSINYFLLLKQVNKKNNLLLYCAFIVVGSKNDEQI